MAVKVYCEDCERKVAPEPIPINHILYLLMTLITFGIGVIFWGIAAMSTNDRYRCPICKDDVTKARKIAIEADEKEQKQKKKEQKQRDAEYKEAHGLPWRWRLPVLIVLLFVLLVMGLADSFIAWWAYLAWVFFFLLSLLGEDPLAVREIAKGDWGALMEPLFWIGGIALAGIAIEFAFAFLFGPS